MKLLYCEWVVDQETYERMSMNFCGAEVDAEKANQIADVIEKQLSKMVPGERMLDDFSLTKEPISDDNMADELYSTDYEWLEKFRDFCRTSNGCKVH